VKISFFRIEPFVRHTLYDGSGKPNGAHEHAIEARAPPGRVAVAFIHLRKK
jgi:hypothetical protein